ncbi:MAG: hypothetical protein FD174_3001 [Geobacteraceae bacterium]|nr:MAG: hypothetical protein FD174_3001 [Geobacteraceae bacterium]
MTLIITNNCHGGFAVRNALQGQKPVRGKGDVMRKVIVFATLAGFTLSATAFAGVDLNVNVRAGLPAPPPPPGIIIKAPQPATVVKGDNGKHLGHYKAKKGKKHGKKKD